MSYLIQTKDSKYKFDKSNDNFIIHDLNTNKEYFLVSLFTNQIYQSVKDIISSLYELQSKKCSADLSVLESMVDNSLTDFFSDLIGLFSSLRNNLESAFEILDLDFYNGKMLFGVDKEIIKENSLYDMNYVCSLLKKMYYQNQTVLLSSPILDFKKIPSQYLYQVLL